MTTLELIRDGMETAINAITPTCPPATPFRPERGMYHFPTWAAENRPGALRRYRIREVGDFEKIGAVDSVIDLLTAELEIMVAYPKSVFGGMDNTVKETIECDRCDIDFAIGIAASGNYVSGQHLSARQLAETDDDPDLSVAFSRMVYRVEYRKAVLA